MAGNCTPAPSNDIDWLDYMDYQNWSELPETGLDFMQGAEAGLGGANSPPTQQFDGCISFTGRAEQHDYDSQGSSQLTIAPLKSAAIDSPNNQHPHHDAIIRHGIVSHACVTGHAYSSPAGNFDDREGVNFDSTRNSAALDFTPGTVFDSKFEDFVSSSPEVDAVTTAQTDTIKASDTDIDETCACITCCDVGGSPGEFESNSMCHVPGCHQWYRFWYSYDKCGHDRRQHERRHFGAPGQYACAKPDCRYGTKKFGDLLRHTTSMHCTNPNAKKWPCAEIGCKFSGSNGFTRKDKLKSHRETCHAGKAMPGKPYRVIKPAPGGK